MLGIITALAATALSSFSEGAMLGASAYLVSRGVKRGRKR